MVKNFTLRKAFMLSAAVLVAMSICAPFAMAQEHAVESVVDHNATTVGEGIREAGIALAAAIALVGAAIGTGRAQAAIGAGGTGALAEKPELFTNVLILVALPETIVVLGFVIGFLILGKI